MNRAIEKVSQADVVIIIGTSLQVYPAAGLIDYADRAQEIYYIDQNPASTHYFHKSIKIVARKATIGMQDVFEEITQLKNF